MLFIFFIGTRGVQIFPSSVSGIPFYDLLWAAVFVFLSTCFRISLSYTLMGNLCFLKCEISRNQSPRKYGRESQDLPWKRKRNFRKSPFRNYRITISKFDIRKKLLYFRPIKLHSALEFTKVVSQNVKNFPARMCWNFLLASCSPPSLNFSKENTLIDHKSSGVPAHFKDVA